MAARNKDPLFHPAIAALNAFDAVKGVECMTLKRAARVKGTVSSGSLVTDLILGGGFARGFVTVFGPEGCGKSTYLQELIVSCQRSIITVVHYDYEGGSDPVYMTNQGISLNHTVKLRKMNKDGTESKTGKQERYPDYFYAQADFGEGAYRHILQTLKHIPPYEEGQPPQIVFIIDSFAAMASEEIDDETGASRISPNARMHSNFLQLIKPKLKRKGALLIGSNQMRTAIGQYGNPQIEFGGAALKFYPDQKLMITRRKMETDKTDVDVLPITVRTPKNKGFIPLRVVEGLGIILGRGIDRALDTRLFLDKTGHLEKGGSGKFKITFPKKETKFLSWADFRKMAEAPRFRRFLFNQLRKDQTFIDYLQNDGVQNYFYDQDLKDYEDEDEIDEEEIKRRVQEEAEEYKETRRRRRRQGKRGRGRSKKQTRDDEELEEYEE